jgi:hypothetical protein
MLNDLLLISVQRAARSDNRHHMREMRHKMRFGEMIMLIDSSSYCKGESQPANMGENSYRALRPISQSALSYNIPYI